MKPVDPYLQHRDQTVTLHGLEFPLEYLYRGLLIVGQPGSGKTRCLLMPLIESILETTGTDPDQKCSLMIADPKNELGPFIHDLLARVGRADDLVVLQPGKSWYDPLSSPLLTEAEIPEKIISWASNTHRSAQRQARGEADYWANAQRALLSALIAATRAIHGTLTFQLINDVFRRIEQCVSVAEASRWLEEAHVPERAVRGITEFLALPKDCTRPCVSNSVSSTLYFWDSEPLASLTTPDESIPHINPFEIMHEGKIVVIGCSGPAYGVSITPLLLALKEHFMGVLLSRDQIDVKVGDQWKPINQSRPVFLVADEFQAYMSVDSSAGELTALDRLRGFNGGMIAATQNISSLISVLGNVHHANRLTSLLSNQAYMANICPATAELAEHILGKKKINEYQADCSPELPAPLLFRNAKPRQKRSGGHRVRVAREVPRVNSCTLAAMKTGEYWLRLADGSVHKKKAPFSSIIASP